jgi:hypothetical protein
MTLNGYKPGANSWYQQQITNRVRPSRDRAANLQA